MTRSLCGPLTRLSLARTRMRVEYVLFRAVVEEEVVQSWGMDVEALAAAKTTTDVDMIGRLPHFILFLVCLLFVCFLRFVPHRFSDLPLVIFPSWPSVVLVPSPAFRGRPVLAPDGAGAYRPLWLGRLAGARVP